MVDLNALGQVIDTSFGRSSTPKTASYSVKLSFAGDGRLLASFAAVVSFASEKSMIETKRRYEDESKSVIDAVIKAVKSNYKDLAGSALTLKEASTDTSVEIINFNHFNAVRKAYIRRKTIFEFS